jgi:hypothetical protein
VTETTSDQTFAVDLSRELRRVVQPVEQAFESSDDFSELLAAVGWDVPASSIPITQIRDLADFETRLAELDDLLDQLPGLHPEDLPPLLPGLASTARSVVEAVSGLATLASSGLQAPFNLPAFWSDVAASVLDLCVFRYIEFRHPTVFGLLFILGVAREDPVDAAGAQYRRNFTRRRIDWSLIGSLFNPGARIEQTYAWGSPTFNSALLLQRLGRLLASLGRTTFQMAPSAAVLDRYYTTANPARASISELGVPLLSTLPPDHKARQIGFKVLPIPASSRTGNPVGVAIRPWIEDPTAPLVIGHLQLTLRGGFQVDDSVAVHLRPGAIDVVRNGSGSGAVDAEVGFTFQRPTPTVLVGSADGTHFEVLDIFAGLHILGDPPHPEIILSFGTTQAAVVIDLSQGDGLIEALLGSTPQRVEFDGTLVWSSKTGFHFAGSAGLELTIPIGKTIAFVTLDSLLVALHASNAGVDLSAALSGAAQIGPVAISLGGVGVHLSLTPRPAAAPPGTFGPLDVAFAFMPPSSVGLAIDAVAVTGGGSLFYDADKQHYGGVLELAVLDQFSVKAIALLTTGAGSFSLMALVFVEDFAPIQLGMGFTLNGVGGAIAINRRVAVEALRAGLKNHALDSLLFPEDPVRNAPRIISDLDRNFPIADGRFVFGPMAKLAWGTPPLITADLALLLELPAPVRLVLLGRLTAVLPTPETPLVELHMDVLGVINFARSEIALDATLHDSRVMEFALSGDMALRATWAGPNQGLVLAVGGLHPNFAPPPGFPKLRRVTLALADSSNPRLRLEAYVALTSNTAQFGAHLDLYAEMDRLALAGQLSFDTLFHFNPFSFTADFCGMLALSYDKQPILALALVMQLSGPSPWRARGRATIDIAGYQLPVDFDVTIGSETPQPALPTVDPHADLVQAFADPRNWAAQLPSTDHMLVHLRDAPPTATPRVVAHPLGELSVHEQVVPLELEITRVGGSPLVAPHTYSVDLTSVRVNGDAPHTPAQLLKDAFAPAQFRDMSDDEKLASPSFESYPAGLRFHFDGPTYAGARERQMQYRQVVVNAVGATPVVGSCNVQAPSLQTQLSRGAAAESTLASSGRSRYRATPVSAPVHDTHYTIARRSTLQQASNISARSDLTLTQACDVLREHVATTPEDEGRYEVVGSHEAIAV